MPNDVKITPISAESVLKPSGGRRNAFKGDAFFRVETPGKPGFVLAIPDRVFDQYADGGCWPIGLNLVFDGHYE